MTLTITAINKADLLAQVADLTGATPGTGTGTGGGGTTPPTVDPKNPNTWDDATVQAKFFPVDYALALFPSPEKTQILVDPNGTYHGAPYLKSSGGAVWKFDRDATGKLIPITSATGSGFKASCNGVPIQGPDSKPQATLAMIVSQGQVYFTAAGGWVQKTQGTDNPQSGNANAAVPVFWSDPFFGYEQSVGGGSGGNSGGVPMPPDPPAPAVKPGSNGTAILFGQGTPFATIKAALATAKPGDTVAYPAAAPRGAVFAESFDVPEGVKLDLGGRWPATMTAVDAAFAQFGNTSNLAGLRAAVDALYVPGAILDGSTLADPAGYSHQNGGIVILGNAIVSGARIKGFGMKETQHGGTGGIRPYGAMVGQMQGSDNYITDCQNGIGPGGTNIISGPWVRTVLVQNGLPDGSGGSHNVYDTTSTVRSIAGPDFYSAVLPFTAFDGGHAYKTRAKAVQLVAPYYLIGSDSSAIDIPDGSALVTDLGTGGKIAQVPGPQPQNQSHAMLGYAVESQTNGVAGVKGAVTLIALCPGPTIFTQGPVDLTGSTWTGTKPVLMGNGTLKGIP